MFYCFILNESVTLSHSGSETFENMNVNVIYQNTDQYFLSCLHVPFLNYIFFMPCSHLSLGSAALCCLDKVHYWDVIVHKTCPTLSCQPFYLTEFVNTRTLTLYTGLTSRKIKTWRRISGKIDKNHISHLHTGHLTLVPSQFDAEGLVLSPRSSDSWWFL